MRRTPEDAQRVRVMAQSIDKALRDSRATKMEKIDSRIKDYIAILAAIHHGAATEPADESAFTTSMFALVSEYMNFGLSGEMARVILWAMIVQVSNLMFQGDASRKGAFQVSCLDHLGSTAMRLADERSDTNVTSYFNLTQLAGLYASTVAEAATNTGWLATPEDRERVELLGANLDEVIASSLVPALRFPARWPPPAGLDELSSFASAVGSTPEYAADYFCVHPALRALLHDRQTGLSDDEVMERYKEGSQRLRAVDFNRDWDVLSPVSAEQRTAMNEWFVNR
jgi:hypothetical protein